MNEVICHGIPDRRPLQEGDIVNGKKCVAFVAVSKETRFWESDRDLHFLHLSLTYFFSYLKLKFKIFGNLFCGFQLTAFKILLI